MVKGDPHRKLSGARFSGPYTVTQVYDNGTVQLSKATNGGAVLTTWNLRCKILVTASFLPDRK
jgi:hypothetical protein